MPRCRPTPIPSWRREIDAETLARAILTPDAPTPLGWTTVDLAVSDDDGVWVLDYKLPRVNEWRTITLEYQVDGRNIDGLAIAFGTPAIALARMVADGRRRHGLVKHVRDERRHIERMHR